MLTRSVEIHFTRDHRRLEHSFKQFQNFKKTDYSRALHAFRDFKKNLDLHLELEEKILSPVFEDKTALCDIGPTVVMRAEHHKIRKALEELDSKFNVSQDTSDEEAGFLKLIEEHSQSEERVIYPVIDELTSYAEREAIFSKIEELVRGKSAPDMPDPCREGKNAYKEHV